MVPQGTQGPSVTQHSILRTYLTLVVTRWPFHLQHLLNHQKLGKNPGRGLGSVKASGFKEGLSLPRSSSSSWLPGWWVCHTEIGLSCGQLLPGPLLAPDGAEGPCPCLSQSPSWPLIPQSSKLLWLSDFVVYPETWGVGPPALDPESMMGAGRGGRGRIITCTTQELM